MTNTEVVTARVNGVPVDDLANTVEAIKATPSIAKFNFRIRNQWLDAARNRSTVDDFYGAGQEQLRSTPILLDAMNLRCCLARIQPLTRLSICSTLWQLA